MNRRIFLEIAAKSAVAGLVSPACFFSKALNKDEVMDDFLLGADRISGYITYLDRNKDRLCEVYAQYMSYPEVQKECDLHISVIDNLKGQLLCSRLLMESNINTVKDGCSPKEMKEIYSQMEGVLEEADNVIWEYLDENKKFHSRMERVIEELDINEIQEPVQEKVKALII